MDNGARHARTLHPLLKIPWRRHIYHTGRGNARFGYNTIIHFIQRLREVDRFMALDFQ